MKKKGPNHKIPGENNLWIRIKRIFMRIWKWFQNFAYKTNSLSFLKRILFFYLVITTLGAALLYIPFAHRTGVSMNFLDALFTSASAFSDTGLATVGNGSWSYFGEAIIAILIFIGGIGWFSFRVYILNILLGRPLSSQMRDLVNAERGSSKTGYSRNVIKIGVTFLIVSLLIATFCLTVIFYYEKPDLDPFNVRKQNMTSLLDNNMLIADNNPEGNYLNALRFGLFHAVSALNNAGFDIIGGNSIAPYYHAYSVQIIFVILFVLGGMGYPVFYDVYNWIKAKRHGERFRWSLFSKLSTIVYFSVTALGLITTFAVELTASNVIVYEATGRSTDSLYSFWNNPMYGSNGAKTMALIFNTMSTRNAGFSTVRIGDLSPITTAMFSLFMFIGSAPSSTAGGIRTTTVGVIIASFRARFRGRSEVTAFKTKINNDTVNQAYIVTITSVMLVLVGFLLTFSSFGEFGGEINRDAEHMFSANSVSGRFLPRRYTYMEQIFEVSSAFGTTGLAVGDMTTYASWLGKLTLISIMFIGQLGVSSSILAWNSRGQSARKLRYMEETIAIG